VQGVRAAAGLYGHVDTLAAGGGTDLQTGVTGCRIEHEGRASGSRYMTPRLQRVDGDHAGRPSESSQLDREQADRGKPKDSDTVTKPHLASTDRDEGDMRRAAKRLLDLGCEAALIKGGHASGEPVDVLGASGSLEAFPGTRINTRHTHGTGCTYSAAITAGLALGGSLRHSILAAKSFIQSAIETAPELGGGYGPANHFARRGNS